MTDRKPPTIPDTPGLIWRPRNYGWEARWQARTDLVKKGYPVKSERVWVGTESELDETAIAMIQDRTKSLQNQMLIWGRGGVPNVPVRYDGTVRALAEAYQTDPDSPIRKVRHVSREYYGRLLSRIVADHGDKLIRDVRARDVIRWHEDWTTGGKIALGHALIGMFRTIVNFGVAFLEDPECERLSVGLSKLKFKMAPARNERLTAEQAALICAEATKQGFFSIALAQAIQFECMLRQKDVIGEWTPVAEPGLSDMVATVAGRQCKWMRGLRWEEIDENYVLRHVTSKRGKLVEVPLNSAPMVMAEFAKIAPVPKFGPIIVSEYTGLPWVNHNFRRKWREIATACGIPKTIRNMDSRAGAISEATDAGADLEHVRHAATHSDIKMTQRYSRAGENKTANVMRIRAEHRNKK